MNRRINELREQARTLVSNEERERGEVYDARAQWDRIDQKFAELIIQECITVSTDHQCFPKDHLTLEEAFISGQEHTVRCINQHFGVE